MTDADPIAAGETTKAVAALVREARSLLRRTDKLAHSAKDVDDPTTTDLAGTVRAAVEQLVHHVGRLEQQRQRQVRQVLRRGR